MAIDMGSQSQVMELAVQQDTYSDQRHEEIRNIENTINQLGSIFQQLATLVAQQGEQVQTYARAFRHPFAFEIFSQLLLSSSSF